MKKALYIILVLALLLSLCACGETTPDVPENTDTPEESLPPVSYNMDEGRLTKEVYYNVNGLKYLTVYFDYDGQGRVIKEMSMGINDAPEGYYINEYDDAGKRLTRISYVAQGPEEFTEDYRISYVYDDFGRCVSEISTSEGKILAKTEYVYDENGWLISELHYQGDSFVAAEYTYSYDENGVMTGCLRKDNMEDETTENRYTYDLKGRMITDLKCDAEGNVLERIEFTYDDSGEASANVLKRSVYGVSGVLMSVENNEYTYDEAGNIIKRVCTDSEGENTVTTEYTWAYSKG